MHEEILLRDELSPGTGRGIGSPGHGAAVVKIKAGVGILTLLRSSFGQSWLSCYYVGHPTTCSIERQLLSLINNPRKKKNNQGKPKEKPKDGLYLPYMLIPDLILGPFFFLASIFLTMSPPHGHTFGCSIALSPPAPQCAILLRISALCWTWFAHYEQHADQFQPQYRQCRAPSAFDRNQNAVLILQHENVKIV